MSVTTSAAMTTRGKRARSLASALRTITRNHVEPVAPPAKLYRDMEWDELVLNLHEDADKDDDCYEVTVQGPLRSDIKARLEAEDLTVRDTHSHVNCKCIGQNVIISWRE